MKERISATVEKETIKLVENILKRGRYRNNSHVIEEAIQLLNEKINKESKK